MNESFQHIQPGPAGLSGHWPAIRRFPRLPWWLGQILPVPRSGAASPGRRGAPLPRPLAPVAPQVDRSPPVGSLPDRPPGRGDERQRIEARGGRRERHHSTVVNSQVSARSHRIPLPTASMHPANSILPLSPVPPVARAWRSIPPVRSTALYQPADAQPLLARSELRGQAVSGAVVPLQPPRPRVELREDGHREYSIDLAR